MEEILAKINSVRELQQDVNALLTTQAQQLDEARRQQITVELADVPAVLHIAMVRAFLAVRAYNPNDPIRAWLESHGYDFGGAPKLRETINVLDGLLLAIYDIRPAAGG